MRMITSQTGALQSLATLLRDYKALMSLIGSPDGTVAVPETARSIAIAALAQLSGRRPVVVACPTSTMATQLADDIKAFMPAGDVMLFPAWETLPFERVSPSVETMGRRLEVLWRLQSEDRTPQIIVASMRALLQQLGPDTATNQPVIIRKGLSLDPDELLRTLVNGGYRREELVEHRGEVARRGAIIDVFPSTADAPIRIDLWGDEVDRLTNFSVHDQRSDNDLEEVAIFPARELILNDAVRERAAAMVGAEPWGREHWERLSEGALFDGMESWLPWLTESPTLLSDILPRGSKMLLIEPRRMRDRAADLLAEEADLAKALASSWARDAERDFPRLYSPPDRLLSETRGSWNLIPVADGPDMPLMEASGWGAMGGSGDGIAERMRTLLTQG